MQIGDCSDPPRFPYQFKELAILVSSFFIYTTGHTNNKYYLSRTKYDIILIKIGLEANVSTICPMNILNP